jgi:hypothetical protein
MKIFKVGDKVKCIRITSTSSNKYDYLIGKNGIITSIYKYTSQIPYVVKFDGVSNEDGLCMSADELVPKEDCECRKK